MATRYFLATMFLGILLGMSNLRAQGWSGWQGEATPAGGGGIVHVPGTSPAGGTWMLQAGKGKSTLKIAGEEAVGGALNRRYEILFTASGEVNPEATVTFALLGKNAGEETAVPLQPPLAQNVNAVPGLQQKLVLTVKLPAAAAAGLRALVPVFSVNDIASGQVVADAFTVAELDQTAVASGAPPPAGYRIVQPELSRFFWHGPVSYDKFAKMLDYAALGLHIMTLTPEHLRGGFHWPDGSAVVAAHDGKGWEIEAVTAATGDRQRHYVAAANLDLACYGSGAVARESGAAGGVCLPAGLHAGGIMQLAAEEAAPVSAVRNLEVYPAALLGCFLAEADKSLQRARQLYQENAEVLKQHEVGERAWQEKMSFYQASLAEARQGAAAATEGFLPLLLDDPLLRDRYNHLVWMANNEFASSGGYFGGEFRRLWFSHLGGHPVVQSAQAFERKVRALVSRARRLTRATFREGTAWQERLSAGWCDALTQVPRRAGLPGPLSREGLVQLAREERESVQLVLSSGRQGVGRCAIEIGPELPPGLTVKSYRVEYVWLSESSNPQLPLREPGESEFPDVLEPLVAGQEFSLGEYQNQAIWLTFQATASAPAGRHAFTVRVKVDGEEVMVVPGQVEVARFALGRNRLENMIGMRFSTMKQFYGEAGYEKARRQLMQELLDHQMNPLDLYAATPPAEDVAWALEQGLTGVNLGGTLHGLAHPAPGMLPFIRLYGSQDGTEYVEIPAEVSLQARQPDGVCDQDLIVAPRAGTPAYRFLKVHNAEIRGWYDRCLYTFFVIYPALGDAVAVTGADGAPVPVGRPFCLQPDLTPERGGVLGSEQQPGTFAFDNLRDRANRSSVIIDLQTARPVSQVRLVNRHLEMVVKSLSGTLAEMQKHTNGKVPVYLYGFDEVGSHLNGQLKSALENARKLFPGVRLVTTAANPQTMPELFASLDVHCPANAYALPRHDQAVRKRYGVDFWTYVGGGGYYPFGNFERVDQPLINSRAFFWEPIAFSHITGFLYWDIHMWRKNTQFAGNLPPVWSEWDTTHGENNGMGALFYPGPDGASWPSMRAEAMRDGIDDYNYTRVAEELLAGRRFADAPSRQRAEAELQEIKAGFARGMSVFCQDPRECLRLRQRLAVWIDGVLDLPEL